MARNETTETMSHDERRERRKQMARYVKGGKSVGETAGKFGVSVDVVKRACEENRVKTPVPKSHALGSTTYRVIALLLKGKPQHAIASMMNMTPQRVSEIARKCRSAGITLPSPRNE